MDSKLLALIAAIALTATLVSDAQSGNEFEAYKAKFGKQYSEVEHTYRQSIYQSNVAKFEAHNSDETQTYKMGINQFTDLTKEEFQGKYLMTKRGVMSTEGQDNESQIEATDINWVTKGAVHAVKDQGQCGSCWCFSAAASSESLKFITTGTLGDFSESQILDCDTSGSGCSGGLEYQAMDFYASNGICTESSYPYKASAGSCKQSSCTKDSFTISGHVSVKGDSALKNSLAKQPTSVAVDAENWSAYSSGIFNNCSNNLDHAVLAAGYTSDYWLIKNSWGTSWGESGYIRLQSGDTCGLYDDASAPKV